MKYRTRGLAASLDAIRDRRRNQGTSHDESERRIPITGNIEKGKDTRRIDHIRDNQADSEKDTRNDCDDNPSIHELTPGK